MLTNAINASLGAHLKLADLEDIEPDMLPSWRWMLENKVEDLDQPFIYELDLFGSKIVQELIENGSDVVVNDENKLNYINQIVLAKSYNEVKEQIDSFKQGLFELIPQKIISLFSSREIETLISGESTINASDLIKHVLYNEKTFQNAPLVIWFKEIVEAMDQEMLANLLFFITGWIHNVCVSHDLNLIRKF